jgi:hypothetical protein
MSLLSALNLPPPKHRLPAGAGASIGLANEPAPPAKAATATEPPPPKQDGGDGADARAQALKLRGAIEVRRKQSADLLLRMQKAEPVLKAKVDAATGAEKKALTEKQALFAKEMSAAQRAVERAEGDLEAIDNPGAKREELLAILARHKAGGKVEESTEITAAGLDPYKKGKINKDVTATTTSYADGQAKTESVRSRQKLGLDGYTTTDSHEKTVTDGQTTARSSKESKTNASLTGKVSTEHKQSVETVREDGTKVSLESKKSKEISLKGASQSQTVTGNRRDGSSVSKTSTQGVERGDGKITASTGSSTTKTNTAGTATTTEKRASGGFINGDDGTGMQGAVSGGKSVKTKGGTHVGVVGGLHASVLCKVGEPNGDPKIYPVTVTVTFGATVGASGGMGDKEGSKGSVSGELKASKETVRTLTRHFTEAELANYTQGLAIASKGGLVPGGQNELSAIALGAQGNWAAARMMWDGTSGTISKKDTDGLTHAGDSMELSDTSSKGGSVKAKVKVIGGGVGKTNTSSSSTKATRNDDGSLKIDAKQERGSQTDISGSVDVGAVGLEVGKAYVKKTRFGYSFSVDPKNDPDGKIVEHLGHCKTHQDYIVFNAVYQGKVTLIGKIEGSTEAENSNVGVSLLGQKATIGTGTSLDQEKKTDAKGKAIGEKNVGSNTAGGEFTRWADSSTEQAVGQTDEKGEASLVVSRSKKDKSGSKKTESISGLSFSNADLKRIGASACRSLDAWNGWCTSGRDKEDWIAAGRAIKQGGGAPGVVQRELVKFVSGDIDRNKTVEKLLRGGYKQTGGKAFEFPDSLRDIQADYDLVSDDGLPNRMNAFANKNGDPAAAKECQRLLAIVDRIQPRVQACKDFANIATKTEMLSELAACRTMLNRAVEGFSGKLKPEDDPKVLATEGERLMKLCLAYGVEEDKLVEKLEDQDAYTVSERSDGKRLIKQLEDMHLRWWNEYHRLRDNCDKRKVSVPVFAYVKGLPHILPNEALVAIYEKKFKR